MECDVFGEDELLHGPDARPVVASEEIVESFAFFLGPEALGEGEAGAFDAGVDSGNG